MNAKQVATYAIVTMVLVGGWYLGLAWIKKAHPEWVFDAPPRPPATAPAAENNATAPTTAAASPATTQGPEGVPTTVPAGQLRAVATPDAAAGTTVDLGSAAKKDPAFAMQLTLNPRGAGIDQVALNDFNRAVKDERPYVFQEPYEGHVAWSRPLATRWVSIDGKQVDLSNVEWALRKGEGAAATYSVDLVGEAGPVARVTKTFTLPQRTAPGKGFEVDVDYKIENLTAKPIRVKTEWAGPTVPPQELAQSDRLVMSGQRKDAKQIVPHQHMIDSFKTDEPSMELLVDDDKHPAQWAGGASAYFNGFLLPISLGADKTQPADYLESIKADRLDPQVELDSRHKKVAITFRTKELDVAANQALTLPLSAYFGPRQREALNTAYYSQLPRAYSSVLVIRSGPCSACTFDWLINGLVSLLGFFHLIFRDWGLAIITLVLIVRACLHPITKRSQVNMMKMGKFGPEIEKLKKKYGDDKDELNRQMMQFYKQHGATPILGCLPMFLQMPIWIALWSVLQSTFELRHAPFLYGVTWIDDLSKPDGLWVFDKPVHLIFGATIGGLNLLPLLLAVVFFLNQKYTPKPPATTPEQEQQQKMMQWMVLIFPLFMYSMPSGLLLYIFASTTIGIIESKVVRDHIKQREALEAARGPVIVDAPPTRGNRRKDRGDDSSGGNGGRGGKGPDKPTPGGWLGRKLAELQEKAEAIKRDAERKGR